MGMWGSWYMFVYQITFNRNYSSLIGVSPDLAQPQQDSKAKDPFEILLVQSLSAGDKLEASLLLLTSSFCAMC